MASRTFNRANVLAGLFLLGSLALAVWMSFRISDRSGYGKTLEFVVRFGLADGAAGLKQGSVVLLGGKQVGRVLAVEFARAKAEEGLGDEVPFGVDVSVEVDGALTFYDDMEIFLDRPLLGSLSTLNIVSVGHPKATPVGSSSLVEPRQVVMGRLAPPVFLASAGFGPEQAQQIRATIADVQTGVNRFNGLLERISPKVETGMDELTTLTRDLKTNWGAWTPKVDSTLTNVSEASEKLAPMLAKVDSGVDDGRTLIADVRSLVAENRAKIDSMIASAERAAAKVDSTTIDLVNTALKDAGAALASFSGVVDRANATVTAELPTIARILANLRLASDQAKLTMIEVRSQPWRLLVRPNTKELGEQLLYDSTRSFAEAASDFRSAAESLRAASASERSPDREEIERLTAQLGESMERYRRAESALLERLKATEPK